MKSSSIQLDTVWFVCQLVTTVTSRLDILSLPAYHFRCSEGLFLVLMSTQFESVYSVEPELFDFCYSKGGHFPVFGSAASLQPSAVRWMVIFSLCFIQPNTFISSYSFLSSVELDMMAHTQ